MTENFERFSSRRRRDPNSSQQPPPLPEAINKNFSRRRCHVNINSQFFNILHSQT
jgi:hypothetical protein